MLFNLCLSCWYFSHYCLMIATCWNWYHGKYIFSLKWRNCSLSSSMSQHFTSHSTNAITCFPSHSPSAHACNLIFHFHFHSSHFLHPFAWHDYTKCLTYNYIQKGLILIKSHFLKSQKMSYACFPMYFDFTFPPRWL